MLISHLFGWKQICEIVPDGIPFRTAGSSEEVFGSYWNLGSVNRKQSYCTWHESNLFAFKEQEHYGHDALQCVVTAMLNGGTAVIERLPNQPQLTKRSPTCINQVQRPLVGICFTKQQHVEWLTARCNFLCYCSTAQTAKCQSDFAGRLFDALWCRRTKSHFWMKGERGAPKPCKWKELL